jgi:hypothetical protein
MKRVPRMVAALALPLLIGVGVFAWQELADPLSSLPRAAAALPLGERRSELRAGRLLRHVTLADERLGHIDFTISLPDPLPEARLPLVVVLGGLGTGANNIRAIDSAGDNAIIGYDWPLPTAFPQGIRAITAIPSLRHSALIIPGQVSAMLRWLAQQPWSDPGRTSILGFSLGAIAAPAVERVAREEGIDIGWTVLAFGGVGLAALIEGDQYIKPAWARPLLGRSVAVLLRPLEPAGHLPHLAGRFLILSASRDSIIDLPASAALEALAPEPKTIIRFAGDHIGTGQGRQALLAEAIAATRRWLAAEGAINAGEP